ncbi:MAG: glycoside hydrolase family 16 protein [Mucinivorans sp.]
MKKLYLLLPLLVVFSCTNNLKAPQWQEVWCDNFDGPTLNDSVWSRIPRGQSDWQRHMSDLDSLYAMRGGSLVLRGIQNTILESDTAAFLTGGVWTKEKKFFDNGLLEIRARLGSAKGAWPAFWMLGRDGAYPTNGEVDIMEHLNYDSMVYQTIHSVYTLQHKIKERPRSGCTAPIDSKGWNTYGVELGPDSLSFYVNSKKTMTYPRIDTTLSGQYPFGNPMYLLLDMQLGGSWVGAVDPSELPVEMEIDYVKFFQKK